MKSKLLIFSLLSIVSISQISFINSKNVSLIAKTNNNPYIPYGTGVTTFSGKSMDLVSENNNMFHTDQTGTAIAYLQVFDNTDSTYLNHIRSIQTTGDMANVNYQLQDSSYLESTAHFYPSLSNIKNKNTYYMTFSDSANSNYINTVDGFASYALGSATNELTTGPTNWSDYNDDATYDPTEFTHYEPTDAYPYIEPYSSSNTDVFQMGNQADGYFYFTIKVNNWTNDPTIDYLMEEEKVGITLINEDESDEYLKYEQKQATLVGKNDGYYKYKFQIPNLENNYSLYSINFSGLTIGNEEYYPDFDIRLTDELNVPKSQTTIYIDPYIDPTDSNVFSISDINVTSIEFSLKVVDTRNSFYNNLLNVDNTMDVTILNEDTQELSTTEATYTSHKNQIFTFRIENLTSKTNYQIISLDNTGLIINGVIDNEILINEDLNITTNDSSFKTKKESLSPVVYILIVILILFVIAAIFIYFRWKRGKSRDGSSKAESIWSEFG